MDVKPDLNGNSAGVETEVAQVPSAQVRLTQAPVTQVPRGRVSLAPAQVAQTQESTQDGSEQRLGRCRCRTDAIWGYRNLPPQWKLLP